MAVYRLKSLFLSLVFSLVSLFGSPLYAQLRGFDQHIHQATLKACNNAEVGANTYFKKFDSWVKRTGFEKKKHNSNPETYVWVHDYSFIKDSFLDVFLKFQVNTNQAIQRVLKSPGYRQALNDCFPKAKYGRNAEEIKRNFTHELLPQIVIGKVLGVSTAILGPKGVDKAIGGALKVGGQVGARLTKPIAAHSPRTAVRFRQAYRERFPGGLQRTATGALRLTAVAYLASFIYEAYVNGGHHFKDTVKALVRGNSEDITQAFTKDLSNAMDDQLEKRGIGNSQIVAALKQTLDKVQTEITRLEALEQELSGISSEDNSNKIQQVRTKLANLKERQQELKTVLSSFEQKSVNNINDLDDHDHSIPGVIQ